MDGCVLRQGPVPEQLQRPIPTLASGANENCRLRNRCANSIPLSVMATCRVDLKLSSGLGGQPSSVTFRGHRDRPVVNALRKTPVRLQCCGRGEAESPPSCRACRPRDRGNEAGAVDAPEPKLAFALVRDYFKRSFCRKNTALYCVGLRTCYDAGPRFKTRGPARGMAQSGSASALGAEGRGFESLCPDHFHFGRLVLYTARPPNGVCTNSGHRPE